MYNGDVIKAFGNETLDDKLYLSIYKKTWKIVNQYVRTCYNRSDSFSFHSIFLLFNIFSIGTRKILG